MKKDQFESLEPALQVVSACDETQLKSSLESMSLDDLLHLVKIIIDFEDLEKDYPVLEAKRRLH